MNNIKRTQFWKMLPVIGNHWESGKFMITEKGRKVYRNKSWKNWLNYFNILFRWQLLLKIRTRTQVSTSAGIDTIGYYDALIYLANWKVEVCRSIERNSITTWVLKRSDVLRKVRNILFGNLSIDEQKKLQNNVSILF